MPASDRAVGRGCDPDDGGASCGDEQGPAQIAAGEEGAESREGSAKHLREQREGGAKLIPLQKAKESRRNRHKNNRAIAVIERLDEPAADLVESSARQDAYRAGGWKKIPDDPLGEVIAGKVEARKRRVGRKSRSGAVNLSDPDQLSALLAKLPFDGAK